MRPPRNARTASVRTTAVAPTSRPQRGIQSVEVGGQLLLALAHQGRPMALKDLAREAGMTAAKAHPYLVSFGKLGLIEQDAVVGPLRPGPAGAAARADQPAPARPGAPGHAADRRAGARARPDGGDRGVGQPRADHRAHRGGAVGRAREHAPRHGDEPARHGLGPAVRRLPAARAWCWRALAAERQPGQPAARFDAALRRRNSSEVRAHGPEPAVDALAAGRQRDGRAGVRRTPTASC